MFFCRLFNDFAGFQEVFDVEALEKDSVGIMDFVLDLVTCGLVGMIESGLVSPCDELRELVSCKTPENFTSFGIDDVEEFVRVVFCHVSNLL